MGCVLCSWRVDGLPSLIAAEMMRLHRCNLPTTRRRPTEERPGSGVLSFRSGGLQVQGGSLCFEGTRIDVDTIRRYLDQSPDYVILAAYPSLTQADLDALRWFDRTWILATSPEVRVYASPPSECEIPCQDAGQHVRGCPTGISGNESDVVRSHMEWAVRTADGYIDRTPDNRAEAESVKRESDAEAQRGGKWELHWGGAEVVARRVTTTGWHSLTERCPGHALSECADCGWKRE